MKTDRIESAFTSLIEERENDTSYDQAQSVKKSKTNHTKGELYVDVTYKDIIYKTLRVEWGPRDLDPKKSTVSIEIKRKPMQLWFFKKDIEE